MNSGRNSLLIVGAIVLFFYLYLQSQSKTRGLTAAKNTQAKAPACTTASTLGKLLGGLLGTNKKAPAASPKGGGGSGAGSGSGGSGSGGGTAAGKKMCDAPPCGGNAFVGNDSSGNDIYQRPDGSLVYSDGSAATQCDIATNACGLTPSGGITTGPSVCCAGSCCTVQCQPQCVDTAQPCFCFGACGGCSCGGCFCCGCV